MRFTETHEWVSIKGSIATVGITDYARNELGEIVHVELPKVGHPVEAGEEVCVLESTKAAADIYSPISGKITAVNDALKVSPAHINHAPETEGWLYQVEVTKPKECEILLTRTQYNQLIEGNG